MATVPLTAPHLLSDVMLDFQASPPVEGRDGRSLLQKGKEAFDHWMQPSEFICARATDVSDDSYRSIPLKADRFVRTNYKLTERIRPLHYEIED